MLLYLAKRLIYTIPIVLGVAVVCFILVHIAPGSPLDSVLPPDASSELKQQLMRALRLRPALPGAVRRAGSGARCSGDLGTSVATSRPVAAEVLQGRRQHVHAGERGDRDRLRSRFAVRLRRRHLPRHLDRQARLGDLGDRRVGAALLARHGAGDHLLRAPRLAAADRRGTRRLGRTGPGTGCTFAIWCCRR